MGKARAIEEKKQRTMGKTQKLKISKSPRPTKKTLSPPQSPDPAKHYGLTRVLDAPVKLANAENKEFVFQYDVKFTDGLTCGGEQRKNERERERELREIFFLLDVEIARNFFFFFFFFFSLARAFPLLSLPHSLSLSLSLPLFEKQQQKTTQTTKTPGAYAKLLSDVDSGFKAEDLVDSTPFSVMFGPDKCGATNKVHLIFKHAQPNGTVAERHLVSPPLVEGNGGDKLTHVYTLILRPSNSSFDLLIDGESRKSGSLLDSALFDPPFVPPKEVDDAEDKKPEDWVELEKIPDPEAKKPEDWDEDAPREIDDMDAVKPEGWLDDEPASIPDPEATQPEDWDEEEDGAWEAPSVPNPKCAADKGAPGCGPWTRPTKPNPAFKGKWIAPLVDNPEYKGPWKPRKVANPDYYDDAEPLKNVADIGGVAFEIWTMVRN